MAKQTIRNPFLHSHDHHHDHDGHHHDHDHAGGSGRDIALTVTDELDPAQRSLADALRVSFVVLQIVMVILLLLYLGSNVFNVNSQQVAVRLRFGKIVGETKEQQVIPPGGPHFALPYPIEQVVFVPTSQQQLSINDAFWFEITAAQAGQTTDEMTGKMGPLNPEKDGSLITGDANIVHARWSMSYHIDDPIAFITHVAQPTGEAGAVLEAASAVVRAAAEQAVVAAIAETTADDVLRGRESVALTVQAKANRVLREMETGIVIDSLSLDRPTMPMSVRPDFDAVINAENTKARLIDEAEKERARILGEAAGEAALPTMEESTGPLLQVIGAYEAAVTRGDDEAVRQLEEQLDRAFASLELAVGDRVVPIGGEAARIMKDAIGFRTRIESEVRAEAALFQSEFEQYLRYPQVVKANKWYQAVSQMLTGDVETIFLPPGQPYVELNRDPDVRRQREEEALRAEQGR